jgi:colicin import membrane protein
VEKAAEKAAEEKAAQQKEAQQMAAAQAAQQKVAAQQAAASALQAATAGGDAAALQQALNAAQAAGGAPESTLPDAVMKLLTTSATSTRGASPACRRVAVHTARYVGRAPPLRSRGLPVRIYAQSAEFDG